MTLSGWCSPAPGASHGTAHRLCRSERCECPSDPDTHGIGAGQRAFSGSATGKIGATNTDGPRRCVNTVDPGALPTNEESTNG